MSPRLSGRRGAPAAFFVFDLLIEKMEPPSRYFVGVAPHRVGRTSRRHI